MKKTALKNKADRLFSEFIRSQGVCEWCGRSNNVQLQCAHIFSRRYLVTRWEPINAVCLCAGCHRKAHDQPVEFTEFVKEYLGEEIYNELRHTAKTKVDKNIYENLVERIKGYQHL